MPRVALRGQVIDAPSIRDGGGTTRRSCCKNGRAWWWLRVRASKAGIARSQDEARKRSAGWKFVNDFIRLYYILVNIFKTDAL